MSLVFSGAGSNVLRVRSQLPVRRKRQGTAEETNEPRRKGTGSYGESSGETEIDMTFHLLLLVPNVPSLRDLYAGP